MAVKKKSQRAIIYAAAIGGMTEAEANDMLAECGYPPVNSTSWGMLLRRYVPKFLEHPELIGASIVHPFSIKDLLEVAHTMSLRVPLSDDDE